MVRPFASGTAAEALIVGSEPCLVGPLARGAALALLLLLEAFFVRPFASATRGAGGAREGVVRLVLSRRADEAGVVLPKVAFVAGSAVVRPGCGARSRSCRYRIATAAKGVACKRSCV